MSCDHFTWVDPDVDPEEKSRVQKLEVEMRCLRSKMLSITATLHVCKDNENFFKSQATNATRGELLWMALFMMTVLMQTMLLTILA